jgi:AMMECR1 domain-containing protein
MSCLTTVVLVFTGLALVFCNSSQVLYASDSDSEKTMIAIARSAVVREVIGDAPKISYSPAQTLPVQGVFVTIERRGVVVGCRGTLLPQTRTLGEEITSAARAASSHDPRYRPLTPADLRDFQVTVTLVDRLEPLTVAQIETLAPAEGLVLTSGTHTGIVLPWEGKDPRVRLRWAYKKASLSENSPCTLKRLIARRFRG